MLELDDERPTAKALWRNRPGIAASSLANTPVFTRETIYGCDVQTSSPIAFNPRNGERFWRTKEPTFGERKGRHAICFVVRHKQSDRYFILSETGDLILAKLTPEAYEELWASLPSNRPTPRWVSTSSGATRLSPKKACLPATIKNSSELISQPIPTNRI